MKFVSKGLGIAEVVLLPPQVGTHIFGWHQPSVVAKRCEFAAQVMRANAGFNADQARRNTYHLTSRAIRDVPGVPRKPRRSIARCERHISVPQDDVSSWHIATVCQSALNWAPLSASKRDPFERLVLAVALAPSELAGVATTARARAGT